MSFTKYNDPAAVVNNGSYAAQAQPDKVDWDIVTAGSAGTGVVSGCAVTAQGTPNMTVAVAAGTVAVLNAQAAVTAGNVTITAANATNPRIDLIVSSSSGVLSAVAGTAAAVPCMPNVPASSVALAEVYVPANATTITTAQIRDCRVPIGTSGDATWTKVVGGVGYTNSWTDTDGTNRPTRFRKVAGGLVVLDCFMTPGTYAAPAFTLPAGYRPGATAGSNGYVFAGIASTATSPSAVQVGIDPTGVVIVAAGAAAFNWVMFKLTFLAEN